MARSLLISVILAAVAITVSVATTSERRERQLRALLGGGGGGGGGGGQPGQPGGLFGGGGGGGGGGYYGGAGGGAGQPGLPGGMYLDDDYSDFTLEDMLPILTHATKRPASAIVKPKVKLGPKCKDVNGVKDFVEGKHKKKEWLTYLLKLVDDGKKECAEDLSEQLLDQ